MDDLKKRKAESGTGVAVDGVNKRPKVQMFGTGVQTPGIPLPALIRATGL